MNHTVWFILYGAKKLLFNKFQKDFREWFSRRLVFDDTLLCFSEYGFLIFFGYFLSFTTTRGIFQTRTVKNYLYDNKWDNAVLNSHVRGLCFGPYQSDKRKSRCDEYCDGEKDLVGRFSRASFQKYTKMTEQVTFSGNQYKVFLDGDFEAADNIEIFGWWFSKNFFLKMTICNFFSKMKWNNKFVWNCKKFKMF